MMASFLMHIYASLTLNELILTTRSASQFVWGGMEPWVGVERPGGLAGLRTGRNLFGQHALFRHYLLLFVLPEICRVSLLTSKSFVHN